MNIITYSSIVKLLLIHAAFLLKGNKHVKICNVIISKSPLSLVAEKMNLAGGREMEYSRATDSQPADSISHKLR